MSDEVWANIPGLEGAYQVSSLGAVRSLSRTIVKSNGAVHHVAGRTLKGSLNSNGYPSVCVSRKFRTIHRMVAQAFLGPAPGGATDVNHINGDRSDNRVENLEWATRSQNMLHAVNVLGRKLGPPGRRMSGGFCQALSARTARPFRISDPTGTVHEGVNLAAFCRDQGLPYNELLKLRNGSRKTASTGWRLLPNDKQQTDEGLICPNT